MTGNIRRAVGLMSGTSLDGIDAAVIETDGERIAGFGPFLSTPYDEATRERLRAVLGATGPVTDIEREITDAHATAVARLMADNGLSAADIDVIGFHGHTIDHRPGDGVTRQIGDGARLAAATGIGVVCDFRSADVAAGGEGAPFASLFHEALCRDLEKPVCVLNVGGMANITWIGEGASPVAFDTGPGNGLIDQWVGRHTGALFDSGGALAATGAVDEAALARYLADPYFAASPPKSVDRLDFDLAPVDGLSLADGATTLTALTCRTVALALPLLPAPPTRWLVTGGGRHNPVLMAGLATALGAPVLPVEAEGWNGDAIEAQAFGFLAVRALDGLPLSVPTTTGVPRPTAGGVLYGTYTSGH